MHSPESQSAWNPTLVVVNREQSHGFINVLGHMMVYGPMWRVLQGRTAPGGRQWIVNCSPGTESWGQSSVPFAFYTLATPVCIKLLHPREKTWFCPSQGLSNSWSICLECCSNYWKLSLNSHLSFWSQVIVFMSGNIFYLPFLYLLNMLWMLVPSPFSLWHHYSLL